MPLKIFELINVNSENAEIYYRYFKEIFPQDEPTTDQEKVINYERWLVVTPGGEALGICGIYGLKNYPGDAWLDWYGILPNKRRLGYGKAVLMHMLDLAEMRNNNRFLVWTTDLELIGTELEALYQNCGLNKTQWQQCYHGAQVYTFDKHLNKANTNNLDDLNPIDWLH